ncbi:MAG TPA: hypothetical protein VND98_05340 [Solirubrobacterales bacterium]|nr:hypothetical protein [Solirubrobacterales bacterium]
MAAQRCRSPFRIQNLHLGSHTFSARAIDHFGRRGQLAWFRWEVVEPKPFEVKANADGLQSLYPGAAPVELPLTIRNPNPQEIRIVSLRVQVTQSPPGCNAAENLAIRASSASKSSPLAVPAGGSAALPAAGMSAPAIQLLDLPTNQDACQGGQFLLQIEGLAHE